MIFSVFKKILQYQSSTRAIALVRIGIIPLLWSRFSGFFLLFKNIPEVQIGIGFLFFISTIFVFIGFYTRFWLGVLSLTMISVYYYVGFVIGVEPLTHHHTYLLCITVVLLFFTPCGYSFSVDRFLRVRNVMKKENVMPPEEGPLWATYLIALQISAIYFWSTYSKLVPGFLSGDRMEQIFKFYFCNYDFIESSYFPSIMFFLAISTIILEMALAIGLWFSRFHPWIIPAGIIFHLILFYSLPVSTFSLTMILLYLVFIPPEKVHRFIDIMVGDVARRSFR